VVFTASSSATPSLKFEHDFGALHPTRGSLRIKDNSPRNRQQILGKGQVAAKWLVRIE
jgi:hypothetical protein